MLLLLGTGLVARIFKKISEKQSIPIRYRNNLLGTSNRDNVGLLGESPISDLRKKLGICPN